jgi:hypothetical protein
MMFVFPQIYAIFIHRLSQRESEKMFGVLENMPIFAPQTFFD